MILVLLRSGCRLLVGSVIKILLLQLKLNVLKTKVNGFILGFFPLMIKQQGKRYIYIIKKHSSTCIVVTKAMRYNILGDYLATSEEGINRSQALEFSK